MQRSSILMGRGAQRRHQIEVPYIMKQLHQKHSHTQAKSTEKDETQGSLSTPPACWISYLQVHFPCVLCLYLYSQCFMFTQRRCIYPSAMFVPICTMFHVCRCIYPECCVCTYMHNALYLQVHLPYIRLYPLPL